MPILFLAAVAGFVAFLFGQGARARRPSPGARGDAPRLYPGATDAQIGAFGKAVGSNVPAIVEREADIPPAGSTIAGWQKDVGELAFPFLYVRQTGRFYEPSADAREWHESAAFESEFELWRAKYVATGARRRRLAHARAAHA